MRFLKYLKNYFNDYFEHQTQNSKRRIGLSQETKSKSCVTSSLANRDKTKVKKIVKEEDGFVGIL